MGTLEITFVLVGTLAFFVTVYISVKHPDLTNELADGGSDNKALIYFEKVATWVMWAGWGCAAVLILFEKTGGALKYFESL